MKKLSRISFLVLSFSLLLILSLSSCDMMHEDRDDCPYGLYIKFKYDYNLQRADMFNDHVQHVTLYIFDEQGRFVKSQTDDNTISAQPLECPCYKMHITDLAPGRYKFIALATTPSPKDPTPDSDRRAKFRAPGLADSQDSGIHGFQDIDITLDHTDTIPHLGLPLDTLWHGIDMRGIEVKELTNINPVYDTISLVRDTKRIMVSLCNLDDDVTTDINDYSLKITDRNTHLLWDNSLDETAAVTYTPYACWNATAATDASADASHTLPQTAHAEFMTSRILYHANSAQNARITIHSKQTQQDIVDLDLADLLCRLRNYDDRYRYTPQEFLDRGYDYNLEFFLKGGKLQYVDIGITVGVLSWAKRIQFVEL